METSLQLHSVDEIGRMAKAIAGSGLFGVKSIEQAMSLMLIAQAEGLHPATAARDYHVIQGRPTLKADAQLSRFMQAGGSVEWHALSDALADATFRHPQGGQVRLSWDMDRASRAGLSVGKDNWKKYPRAMLRARLISEGVRTVYPGCTIGLYTPEEAVDFDKCGPVETLAEVIDIKPNCYATLNGMAKSKGIEKEFKEYIMQFKGKYENAEEALEVNFDQCVEWIESQTISAP